MLKCMTEHQSWYKYALSSELQSLSIHHRFESLSSALLHQLHHATPHLALEADLVFAPTTCEHGAAADTTEGPPLLTPAPPPSSVFPQHWPPQGLVAAAGLHQGRQTRRRRPPGPLQGRQTHRRREPPPFAAAGAGNPRAASRRRRESRRRAAGRRRCKPQSCLVRRWGWAPQGRHRQAC